MAPLTSIQMLLIILLCLASSELGADRVHGQQLDTRGFIGIDCGIAGDAAYSDDSTHGIRYIPDAGFVDAGAGLNAGISPPFNDPNMAARYLTIRYFPPGSGGRRGCYTLRPLTPGGKYLVRSSFYYGNYDGENRFPAFDLHLGGERWATVNVTAAGTAYVHEAVVVAPAPADYLQVCVVDLGLGTPFISGLDLRPLAAAMYPEADAGHSLALLSQFRPAAALGFNRYHFWPAGKPFYRYPFDRYDRIWQRFGTDFSWTNITTSDTVNTSGDVPSLVLQSAAAPAMNGSRIDISWSSSGDPSMITNNMTYLLLLYFAELQRLPGDELRQFDILVDNASWNGSRGYVPKYLSAEAVSMMVQGSGHQQQQQQHTVSLVATANATLPPILNAFEVYSVQQLTEFQTNVGDEAFSWDGLNCSYSSSGPVWIAALNMKSSGLTGPIDASFGNLKSLQYLDLSNNSLSGPVPDFLAQIQSLKFLDLSSNDLSGSIPAGLLQRQQNGSLILRMDNNANLCSKGASNCELKNKGRKRVIIISIVVPILIATLLFATVMLLRRMRNRQDTWMANNSRINSPRDGSNILENYRQFTYKELKLITANFKEEIGQGGFGTVFLGNMDNETPVAVKMRSKKSSQGDKEFLAEARYLSRVHHRNLVSLIGFCKDKSHLGLVYEYMQGGNLEDHLRGEAFVASPLTWHQRLKIALDSAHGLEYLHKSCQPPLIHRDVKTKNILLSANLEAKISDFGLTKVFTDEFATHVTTQPAGTLGYLDPEYYNTSRLSEKSDVYSFGVVLLEIIMGQPPAVPINDNESIHIAQWVRQKLSDGNIESVADPRMGGEYDINSVWKVAELALNCKEQPSRERPSMTDVVAELKESLELEVSHAMGYYSSVTTSVNNLSATSVDLQTDHAEASDARQQTVIELGQAGNDSETRIGPTQR